MTGQYDYTNGARALQTRHDDPKGEASRKFRRRMIRGH